MSDTLNALGESPIVALPEEPFNLFIAELGISDLQALTPDMILYEPEYWNRYELELGEEGEGGTTGYEPILSNEGPSVDGVGSGWPHLAAYITPQVILSSLEEVGEEISAGQGCLQGTEQGARTLDTREMDNACQLGEGIPRGHDSNAPLNELLCQWNTQSTIGDVLRDFHWIIAYVLEGMQQYEAGMAPWPRLSQGSDRKMRDLTPEDAEGNISIASASRRVLSLLESTGIPQAESRLGSVASRTSRIPRPAKKAETPEDEAIRARESMDQGPELIGANRSPPLSNLRNATTSSGVVNAVQSERPYNLSSIDTRLSRTLSWSVMEENERTTTSCSPDKRSDIYSRVMDLGHTGSKIPVLSPRPDGGNVPSMKVENAGHKLTPKGGDSPRRGRKSRSMAGEIQTPIDLHLSRGREVTRDNSPLVGRPELPLTLPVQTKPDAFTYFVKDKQEDVLEEMTEKKKKEGGFDKENRRPDV